MNPPADPYMPAMSVTGASSVLQAVPPLDPRDDTRTNDNDIVADDQSYSSENNQSRSSSRMMDSASQRRTPASTGIETTTVHTLYTGKQHQQIHQRQRTGTREGLSSMHSLPLNDEQRVTSGQHQKRRRYLVEPAQASPTTSHAISANGMAAADDTNEQYALILF
jgi:hypothetical protein